jgi:hypothetical protein
MSSDQNSSLAFTADEIDLLGRTADALSAYMGKPVLAEIMDAEETGFEWVVFATPLDIHDNADDQVVVQIGGAGARIIGNTGGMTIADGDVFDCEYLWAIQLSDLEGVRFIKVDQSGEEIAWTDSLRDILPFALHDEPTRPDDDDDNEGDEDNDDDEGDDDDPLDTGGPSQPRTLH